MPLTVDNGMAGFIAIACGNRQVGIPTTSRQHCQEAQKKSAWQVPGDRDEKIAMDRRRDKIRGSKVGTVTSLAREKPAEKDCTTMWSSHFPRLFPPRWEPHPGPPPHSPHFA
jgi:hypothetical protein